MPPPLDVCLAVSPVAISDRNVADLQMQMIRAEDQVEIAEGIKLTKMRAVRRDAPVIGLQQDLGAAKRVLDRLAQRPTEGEAKKLVGAEIAEAHRLVFHRVNQPHAISEIGA